MEDLYTRAILGHLAGDYLFQSKEMAIQKSADTGKGIVWCTVHCLIYTFLVCLFMWNFKLKTIILVFLSHFPIDRYSLGEKWLKMIKGRDLKEEYKSRDDVPEAKMIKISFASIVYTVVDNTLHFILLWFITLLIKREKI